MKLEQFLCEYFKADHFIEVQAQWLQAQMKELRRKESELEATKKALQGQMHKNDRLLAQLELATLERPPRLDERV